MPLITHCSACGYQRLASPHCFLKELCKKKKSAHTWSIISHSAEFMGTLLYSSLRSALDSSHTLSLSSHTHAEAVFACCNSSRFCWMFFAEKRGCLRTRYDASSVLLGHIHIRTTPKCHCCSLTAPAALLLHLQYTRQSWGSKTWKKATSYTVYILFYWFKAFAHINTFAALFPFIC